MADDYKCSGLSAYTLVSQTRLSLEAHGLHLEQRRSNWRWKGSRGEGKYSVTFGVE